MRKFYPKINGSSITNVADLRTHFVRDEVLKLYRDGTLRRWLDFFPAEADRTARLDALDPDLAGDDLWAALCEIFGVEVPAEDTVAAPPAPEAAPSPEDALRDKIIQEYLDGYAALMAQMTEHRDDFTTLCADARQLEETYLPLFRVQCRGLFLLLRQDAPKAIFAIAARDTLRGIWRRALAAGTEDTTGKNVKAKKAAARAASVGAASVGVAVELSGNLRLASSVSAGSSEELPSSDPLAEYCKDNCKTVLDKRCRTWSQRYRGSTKEYFARWRPAEGLRGGVLLLRMDGMHLRSAADPERVLTDDNCCFERVYEPQFHFEGRPYSEGTAHVYYLEV